MASHVAPMQKWVDGPLPDEVVQALSRLTRTDGVSRIAVMPDVHLAQNVCIGTVLACRGRLFPEAVGNDIGCGMAAMGFEAEARVFEDTGLAWKVLGGLARVVPPTRHPLGRQTDWLPDSLRDARLSTKRLTAAVRRYGRTQFGTLGQGNHFLELQSSDSGRLWVMVHSGSRGVGHTIANHHLGQADRSNTGLLYIDATSEGGRNYLSDAAWAVEYARQNRARMIESTALLLEEVCRIDADRRSYFDSVHNFVRHERLNGDDVYVHRKGANSSYESEPSIIPGSMGTASYHVVGRGNSAALNSCSHGSGRAMSRSKARRVVTANKLKHEMRGIHFDHSKTHFMCGEAPTAYKDIEVVMRAQRDLVKRTRKLTPVLVYKG